MRKTGAIRRESASVGTRNTGSGFIHLNWIQINVNFQEKLIFGVYKVTPDGVAMDKRKKETIKNYPVPTSTKQLTVFLGLAGFYRKFVPRFSPIASPLHKQKNVACVWGK